MINLTEEKKNEIRKILEGMLADDEERKRPCKIFKQIIKEYKFIKFNRSNKVDKDVYITPGNEIGMWTNIDKKEVNIPNISYDRPTYGDCFDLLHEIGHIVAYKNGMSRFMMEFSATQWAIDNMSKYKLVLTDEFIRDSDEYVMSYNPKSKKRLNWEVCYAGKIRK